MGVGKINYSEECNDSDVLKIPRNVKSIRPPGWAVEVVLTQETEKFSTIINQKQMPILFYFIVKKYKNWYRKKLNGYC